MNFTQAPLMRTILFCVLAFAPLAHATDRDDARAFFDEFVEQMNRFDQSLADHYSPSAKIHTLRDGNERLQMTGDEWKTLYKQALPIAQRRGDIGTYEDVVVSPKGKGFRISATRSSTVKCFTDSGFYLDVERDKDGWTITEHYSETVSLSQCKPSDALAASLSSIRAGILPHLPVNLDADTRLESVEVIGPTLVYNQRLHTVSANEMDMEELPTLLNSLARQNVCGNKELSALLDLDASFRYSYIDRDGVKLAVADIFRGLCP